MMMLVLMITYEEFHGEDENVVDGVSGDDEDH